MTHFEQEARELNRIVGEAMGFASLCWDPRPTGVFDSSMAAERLKSVEAAISAALRAVERAGFERGRDAAAEMAGAMAGSEQGWLIKHETEGDNPLLAERSRGGYHAATEIQDDIRALLPAPGQLAVIQCGLPRDHKCDTDGPELCGGENDDGTYWQGLASDPANRRRSSWGSVSCSQCGRTAMENSYWQDWS